MHKGKNRPDPTHGYQNQTFEKQFAERFNAEGVNDKKDADNSDTPTANPQTEPTPLEALMRIWQQFTTHANGVMAAFTILIFAATTAYTVVAILQWCAMLASNKINRDALEAVQRAFITNSLDQRRPKHPNGWFWDITVVWDNSGNTPAIGAVHGVDIKQLPGSPTEEQFQGKFNSTDLIKATIGPKTPLASSPLFRTDTLFFGKELGDLSAIPPLTPPPPITQNVFAWGWMMYRDEFRESDIHLTEFCMQLTDAHRSWDGKVIALVFAATKEHNCTDRYCPDYGLLTARYPK
jgi:hypothetical protein